MSSNNLVLNRFFTQYVFKDLMYKHENQIYVTVIQRYLNDVESKDNGILIGEIYKYLSASYRNEYYYQNTLLNKLLLGRHSINTTTALTQIPIAKSKADFILINGKAVVYEIKSELDGFERLSTQIHDYYKAFNHVCVVTCEHNYEKLNELLEGSSAGIYVLTKKNTLSPKKEPQRNDDCLEHITMFKVLRKVEFEKVLIGYYNKLPEAAPVFYYDKCLEWFEKIPIDIAYGAMLKQLKNRNKIVIDQFEKVPYELKSLIYFSNPSLNEYEKLNCFLRERYGG